MWQNCWHLAKGDRPMIRGFILAGGDLTPEFASSVLHSLERSRLFVIAADGGLEICAALAVEPDLILGDFDTVEPPLLKQYEGGRVERYNPEKDASDLELAAEALRKRGIREGIVLGALGGRADHGFSNIRLCYYEAKQGLRLILLDEQNRICCYTGEGMQRIVVPRSEQWGHYLSIFPIGGAVESVTMEGFRYPLAAQRLSDQGSPTLTVSNELSEAEGRICFCPVDGSGLLVMETRDRRQRSGAT